MATMINVWTVLVMFVKVDALGFLTNEPYAFLDTFGLDIKGFWSVKFTVGGTKNSQFGLWGPTRSTTDGYVIDLNKLTGGEYFSAVRKICSSCPGTPMAEVKQIGSFLETLVYHPFWISWDQATIKMGKGVVVGEEIVVSWMDPNITEVSYFTVGSSDGTTTVSVSYETSCPALHRPAFFPNCTMTSFKLYATGKRISRPSDIISEEAGLTKTDCIHKCLVTNNCISLTLSTSGKCRLTNKCDPYLVIDANTTLYKLKFFSTPSEFVHCERSVLKSSSNCFHSYCRLEFWSDGAARWFKRLQLRTKSLFTYLCI